jgi:aspartate carbamoyltransferase regulatory subunit
MGSVFEKGDEMNQKELLVSKINNGIVVDHISPGRAQIVLNILKPDKNATTIIGSNMDSSTYGKKDIIKAEGKYLTTEEINMIALVAPTATINVIKDWEVVDKHQVKMPETIEDFFKCPNPSCQTNTGFGLVKPKFNVIRGENVNDLKLQCVFCDSFLYYTSILETLASEKSPIEGLVSKEKIQETVLDILLNKDALRIASTPTEFFVLKSGRKSPYFINVGRLTDGDSLSKLKWALGSYINMLIEEKKIEDFDFIFGPAYKGINLTLLACEGLNELYRKNKRYLYDRKEVKEYGDKASDEVIVGSSFYKPGQKILLIDDVISTGKTKIDSIEKLKVLNGHKIVGMVLVVDRQERMGDIDKVESQSPLDYIEEEYKIKTFPILNMNTVFDIVKNQLQDDVKQKWIEYSEIYGTVSLS